VLRHCVLCLLSSVQTQSARRISVRSWRFEERIHHGRLRTGEGKLDGFFREVVGAGRAAEGIAANWLKDLGVVHRECVSNIYVSRPFAGRTMGVFIAR